MITVQELQLIKRRISINPLHFVLGLLMLTIGLVLIDHDAFFLWPPGWQRFFNDDLVDVIAIATGLGLISFVLVGGKSQLANAILLSTTAFYLTMLLVLQTGHVLVVHDTGRLLSVVLLIGWLLVCQYLALHSKTVKRRK